MCVCKYVHICVHSLAVQTSCIFITTPFSKKYPHVKYLLGLWGSSVELLQPTLHIRYPVLESYPNTY